jgi:hypothetical protein
LLAQLRRKRDSKPVCCALAALELHAKDEAANLMRVG